MHSGAVPTTPALHVDEAAADVPQNDTDGTVVITPNAVVAVLTVARIGKVDAHFEFGEGRSRVWAHGRVDEIRELLDGIGYSKGHCFGLWRLRRCNWSVDWWLCLTTISRVVGAGNVKAFGLADHVRTHGLENVKAVGIADEEAGVATALGLEVSVELVVELMVDQTKSALRRLPCGVKIAETSGCCSARDMYAGRIRGREKMARVARENDGLVMKR